jgi:voltage-gated sodium channel
MYTQMYGCEHFGYDSMQALCRSSRAQPLVSQLFFISFVLVGTMIILNLFIGVIMNSMQEAAAETEKAVERKRRADTGEAQVSVEHELFEIHRAMNELSERLLKLQRRSERPQQTAHQHSADVASLSINDPKLG